MHGTIRALERDLKLNDPRIIDAYQATLIQQLINHNVRSIVEWLLHERQGRGNKQSSSRPRVLHSAPKLRSIAQVKVHCTSIECIDDISITYSPIHEISFSCPWRTQYELLPSHLRRIIGPCPPPTTHLSIATIINMHSIRQRWICLAFPWVPRVAHSNARQ